MGEKVGTRGESREGSGSSPPLQSPTVPIDLDQALAEFLGKRALLESLVDRLLDEAETQIDAFKAALEDEDWEKLRQTAHRTRGGAANLVAMPLASAARGIEASAGSHDRIGVERALRRYLREFRRLRRFVSDRRSQQAEPEGVAQRRRGCES